MILLLAWGLEGLALIYVICLVCAVILDPRTRARALGYLTGICVGLTCLLGGPSWGFLAVIIAFLTVTVGLPILAGDRDLT